MKAQADCQKAAVEFQRAAGVHAAAKVIKNIDSWIIEIEPFLDNSFSILSGNDQLGRGEICGQFRGVEV